MASLRCCLISYHFKEVFKLLVSSRQEKCSFVKLFTFLKLFTSVFLYTDFFKLLILTKSALLLKNCIRKKKNSYVTDFVKYLHFIIFPFLKCDKKREPMKKERCSRKERVNHIYISTIPSSLWTDREVFDAVMKSDGCSAQSSLCSQGQVK